MRSCALLLILMMVLAAKSYAVPAKPTKKVVPATTKETGKKKPSGLVKIGDPGALTQATPSPTPAAGAAEKKSVGDILKELSKSRQDAKASLGAAVGSSIPSTIGAGGNGGGSSGSGGSSNSSGGTQSTAFDDNAAKGEGSGKPPSSGNGGGQTPKIEAYDRWFPTCVFLDPSVPNGNTMVKGLVDMAAACKVNLVVFPFYIKNSPGSADQINSQARQSCNAIQGMQSQGVNRVASATVVPRPDLAAQMCGASAKDRDTCEDLTFNPGDTFLQRYKMTGRGGKVNATGSGIVARNNVQALATTVFRQITGLPYGSGAGLSLGNWNEGDAGALGLQKKDGLNDFGCNELRKSSYPNDGRWRYNSAQETYVVKGDADRMFELGKPIFQNAGGAGGGGSADKGGGSGGGGSGGGSADGGGAGGSGGGSSGGGSSFPSGGGGIASASGGSGHKRPPGGFGTGGGGSGGDTAAGASGSGIKTISGGYGSASGGEGRGGNSGTVGGSGSGGGDLISVGGARGPGGSGGNGSANGTVYDDKANKFETGFGAGGSQLSGARGTGTTVGIVKAAAFDPNALKKSDDTYSQAVATSQTKRPRTISSEGPASGTAFDEEFLKKIGKATRRENRYKGKTVNGGVTTMRRGTDDK